MAVDDMTTLLNGGTTNGDAVRALWDEQYVELKQIAAAHMRRETPAATLQPTALVHEAFVRMVDRSRVSDEGATFFRRCFATECRRILVDAARKRRAEKRGGGHQAHSLSGADAHIGVDVIDILDLHEAIEGLAAYRKRIAEVVDMRIFGGLTIEECAKELGVSTGTVDNDWRFARAWLRQQLEGAGSDF